jgi:hypothetical protein
VSFDTFEFLDAIDFLDAINFLWEILFLGDWLRKETDGSEPCQHLWEKPPGIGNANMFLWAIQMNTSDM